MAHHALSLRGWAARLAALVLSAGCLAVVAPAAAPGASAGDPPHRWAGYRIAATGDAAGGWIGGYRVGGTELYLTTPTRRPNRAGFGSPDLMGDLPGRRASRPDTERAAWILSKYGAYPDATQAAAVDATVYHLLVGGAWRVDARRGARRIRQSGDAAGVARFARIMLRQSRHSAGAYSARITTSGADLGGTVAVTLTVLDGHGRPASGLPVTLGMSGAEPLDSVTGDDGRAIARFAANARGWQDVTAEVHQVPEHRLVMRVPEKEGQAAAAEGGARRELVVSEKTPVRGPQTLSLTADPSQLVIGSPARVLATVTGDGTARAATAVLHGPFASSGAAGCTGPSAGQVRSTVTNDGSYAMPSLTPAGGYFTWGVALDGTDTNAPVASCGAPVKVRGRVVTSILSDVDVATVGELGAMGTVAGMPFVDDVTLTATLSGPYESPLAAATGGCGLVFDQATRVRSGNGAVHFTVTVTQTGWYAWRVQVSPGDLWLGSSSVCGAANSVVGVQ